MKNNFNYLYLLLIPLSLGLIFVFINSILNSIRDYSYTSTNKGEKTKTIKVDRFEEINIVGSMDVELIASEQSDIIITAPSNVLPRIIVESQNNSLQIYSNPWKSFGFNFQFGSNNRTLIKVPFQKLTRIKLTGSGKLVSNSPIVTEDLITNLNGSGDMSINVIADRLESSTSGSGDIKIIGKVNNLKSHIFGSGKIDALGLESQNAKVDISGSGDIKLWAIQNLEAKTFCSGSIYYKGSPVVREIQVSGSGKIKNIE
jgi:Putative auto-transporter adhesin, head GIN domain